MPRRSLEDIPNIAPPPIVPLVRRIVEGEELREITSFLAGRLRCVLDHNGNSELTMRVPAENMPLVIPAMKYPGIEVRVYILVPEDVFDAS